MSEVFAFSEGDAPLLVSVPHDGRRLPDAMREAMTPEALGLPDTDWHVAELYDFVREMGASMIVANYSRYVVDLNRPPDDSALYEGQTATGLCPQHTFAGEPLYLDGTSIASAEIAERSTRYWRPYHDKLAATLATLRSLHGYALIWDAHSIPSRVPRLFDGELPELNLGTWDDRSCPGNVSRALLAVAEDSPYGAVLNGRFKGGYITRQYGDPDGGVHAVQLEVAQRVYMDEDSGDYDPERAGIFQDTLRSLLDTFMRAARVQQ